MFSTGRCSLWSCCLLGQLEIEPGTASFGKILSCLNNQENKLYPVCPGCRRAAYTSGCFQHGQSQKAPQVPLHRVFLDQETSLMRTVNHRSSIWTRVFDEGFRARLLLLLRRKGSWNDWVVLLTTKANVGATSHILSIPLRKEGKLPSSSRYQEHQNCGWKITDDAKEFPCDAWRLMYPCTFLYAILVIGGGTLQHEAAWPNEIERPVVPEDLFVAACEYLDIDPRRWDMRTDPVVGDGSFKGGFAQLVLKKVWGPRGAAAVPSDDFLDEWWDNQKRLALEEQDKGGRENGFRESCWSMYNRFLSCSTIRADAVAPGTRELQERCQGFVQTASFDQCPDRVGADDDDQGGHEGEPSPSREEQRASLLGGYRADGGGFARGEEQPVGQGSQAPGFDHGHQEDECGYDGYDPPCDTEDGPGEEDACTEAGKDAGPCDTGGTAVVGGVPVEFVFAQPSRMFPRTDERPEYEDSVGRRLQHARPNGPQEEDAGEGQVGEKEPLPGSRWRSSLFLSRAQSEVSMSVPSCLFQSDCNLIPPSAFFRREPSRLSDFTSHHMRPAFRRGPGSGISILSQQQRQREGSVFSFRDTFSSGRHSAAGMSVASHRTQHSYEALVDKCWHHVAPISSEPIVSRPLASSSSGLETQSRLSSGLQVCTPTRKRQRTSGTDEDLFGGTLESTSLRTPPGSTISSPNRFESVHEWLRRIRHAGN